MRRNKIASLKQKIICIPIIMMTLISFIIPNYAHAGVGEQVLETIQEIIMMIPDALITGLEKFLLDNDEEIFIQPFNFVDTTPGFIKEIPVVGGIASWINKTATSFMIENVESLMNLIRR